MMLAAAAGHSLGARLAGVAATGARSAGCAAAQRGLYVKAKIGPAAALEKLQMLAGREGIDQQLKARARFLKPTLARQKNKKDAVYNGAKRQKDRLVEEMLADPSLIPF